MPSTDSVAFNLGPPSANTSRRSKMDSGAKRLRYVTLDVFTDSPYSGNQLGVVLLPGSVALSQEQMQNIATEFNYSETIILNEAKDPTNPLHRDLRIFLKDAEVPFAGHPTIGAACFICKEQGVSWTTKGTLNTKAGPIIFTYEPNTRIAELEVPHDVFVHPKDFSPSELQAHGFPTHVTDHAPPKSPFVSIVKGMTFCLIQLPSVEILSQISASARRPEVDGVLDTRWHPSGATVWYLFYVKLGGEDGTLQLRTRMIAGTFEDAAPGSACCSLAAYLALHDPQRDTGGGISKFQMVQGVEMGRRSTIGVDVLGNPSSGKADKILLRGSAVLAMEGSLIVPPAA